MHQHCSTTERRLRKLSQEFPPAAFAFRVHARVLCVGMAVVYRVAITVTATASWAVTSATPLLLSHDWVVAMSQSKLRTFYSHARAILQQPTVCEWRRHNHPHHYTHSSDSSNHGSSRDDTSWQPFEHFLRSIADVLDQYEHLQSAFAVQAGVEALHASRIALEAFLVDCWQALETVVPSLAVESRLPAATFGREVVGVYALLRDLLAFPESILAANCAYASAIVGLEDADERQLPVSAAHVCSICLERFASTAMRALDRETVTLTAGDDEKTDACAPTWTSRFSVRLPCAHLFHENCVMAWLRHNPSCPECRASVVGDQ